MARAKGSLIRMGNAEFSAKTAVEAALNAKFSLLILGILSELRMLSNRVYLRSKMNRE